ncbi:hypothetical protein V8F33_011385 [Rhypophila sp. PSN 637]
MVQATRFSQTLLRNSFINDQTKSTMNETMLDDDTESNVTMFTPDGTDDGSDHADPRPAGIGARKSLKDCITAQPPGTKVIFVVGQSGSGKSTLLNEVGRNLLHKVQTISSGTCEYRVCSTEIDFSPYLFIEIAGFGAADDMDNFENIVACLPECRSGHHSPFTIAGILLVFNGDQHRLTRNDLTTIQWAKCVFGPALFKKITIVTTKWDQLTDAAFEEKWESFSSLFAHPVMEELLQPTFITTCPSCPRREFLKFDGASVYHHGLVFDSAKGHSVRFTVRTQGFTRAKMARDMIRERYRHDPETRIQIVRELDAVLVSGKRVEAARVLTRNRYGESIKLSLDKDNFLRVAPERDPKEKLATADIKLPLDKDKFIRVSERDPLPPPQSDLKMMWNWMPVIELHQWRKLVAAMVFWFFPGLFLPSHEFFDLGFIFSSLVLAALSWNLVAAIVVLLFFGALFPPFQEFFAWGFIFSSLVLAALSWAVFSAQLSLYNGSVSYVIPTGIC